MSALDRLGESAVRVAIVFGYIADVLDVARGAKRRDMLSQGWAWLGLDTVCPLPGVDGGSPVAVQMWRG